MGHGRLGIEPAALAADHDVAVTVLRKPLDLLLCGDAPVEHHARPGGAPSASSMPCRVRSSLTLPANTRERCTKPPASSISVSNLQSLRFSLE